MLITGLGTASPPHCYTQAESWRAIQLAPQFEALQPRSRAILRKVLTGRNGIVTRHLALDSLEEAFQVDPQTLHDRFQRHAPALATQAAARALKSAGLDPSDVQALVVSTCTGYLCPGLTSYVIEHLDLPRTALALDLVGQGCGAALPNLRVAEALLAGQRADCVLSVCVEVCSAAFFIDDDPGVLISACLFGDGAGAAVLQPEPGAGRRIEWKSAESLIDPSLRDVLRFEHSHGLLRNVLRPEVPELAAEHARRVFDAVAGKSGLSKKDVASWIFHPGGRDVLGALQSRLQLHSQDLRWSEAVLREHGNLSSPSVFFVLETALSDSMPSGPAWMSSFGAGFSCHGALLEIG